MVDFIFSVSEIILIVSYLYRDMLKLRIITVLGSIGYMLGAYFSGFEVPGMKALLFFNFIIFAVNLVQAYFIVMDRMPILVPNNLKDVYKNCFSNLSVNEFLKLMKLSSVVNSEEGKTIIYEGKPVSKIILILKGTVKIVKGNMEIAGLSENFFIGEMSFITGEQPNATVIVNSRDFESISWEKKEIIELEDSDPILFSKFKEAIAINLIKKIDRLSSSKNLSQ